MSTPETLCSGCGATVKKMGDSLWFDLAGFIICEKGDADDCHYVNPALPPVAIAPEPQHTPKWMRDVTLDGVVVVTEAQEPFRNLFGEVSDASDHWTLEERFAHADLAAAAPDMLTQLKAAKKLLARAGGNPPWDELHAEIETAMPSIEAAISRAEGGKQ